MVSRRVLLALMPLAVLPRVAAASASGWSRDARSAARLVSAGRQADGTFRAGLHIALEPGTKTYWRTPGDSGVPPAFDWAGSQNLAGVEVAWPAPMRFPDGNGYSIGYKAEVVFPLTVLPRDPGAPVRLALDLAYAVCDRICIPAKGQARLDLVPGAAADPAAAALVARYAARVPVRSAAGLSVAVASLDRSGRRPVLTLSAGVGDVAGPVDLFAEGPDPGWALPLPEPLDGTGPVRRFRLELDGAPAGVDPAAHDLTFTLVAGERALETVLRPA